MKAYIIAELDVTNAEGMEVYRERVTDTIAAYGGRFLVRPQAEQVGGNAELVEGFADEYPLKILIEFTSVAVAKDWYHSSEYQEILPNRLGNCRGKVMLVEGLN